MENVFDSVESTQIVERINNINSSTKPLWGKMNAAQMLAHCSVTYELVYSDKHKKPNAFMRLLLSAFVKKSVVGEKAYKKNLRTAPSFLISAEKEFENEKKRLIEYIIKTQELGENYFEGKESHSFGVLTVEEWNNMFYKHLDHHLNQFGV